MEAVRPAFDERFRRSEGSVYRQVRRVEQVRVGRLGHGRGRASRIATVSLGQRRDHPGEGLRLDPAVELEDPAARPFLEARRDEELRVGLGQYDGADVAAV
jgi:hypothetical protein